MMAGRGAQVAMARSWILWGALFLWSVLGVSAHAQDNPAAREAMIAAITGDENALREAYWSAQKSPAATGGPIALSDAIYYLYNCTRSSRDEFLAGQEIIAANTKNKEWRNRVILSLLTDEIYELNRLEGQNRFNKYTRVFNRVSTSLSQLVMLQPQAAASLLWDGIYSLREGRSATVKERKMIYLCEKYLKKYPSGPERADVLALRDELRKKLLNDRFKALSAAGKNAISDGHFELAEWHLEKATLLNPADADARNMLAQARTLRVRKDEVRGLTLGVADSERAMPEGQRQAFEKIARALVLGDTKTLDQYRNSVPYVWDSVDYAYAAMAEKAGDHQGALVRLQNLAAAGPTAPGGRAATKLLDNPNFNLNESYRAALANMASEKSKFIWTGRRTRDETVYATGNAAIQSASNPVGVPLLFGMDAAVRAISEKFRTQVSVDGVIDAGAKYLRRYPTSPRKQEIAGQLAELSRKAGDYDRSMNYLEESGAGDANQVAKLRENQAVALYDRIQRSGDLLERRDLLKELAEKYPESKIATKNLAKEQAKLPPSLATDTLVLPGKAIGRDHQLARYLGVPAEFADGSRSNGELADEGVAITPSANVVEFKLRNETTWRRVGLHTQGRDWILTAARQLRSDFFNSEEGKQLLYRQRLPFAVDGGVGSGGVDIAPQILEHPTSQEDRRRFN